MFRSAVKCMLVLSVLTAAFSSVVSADSSNDIQGLEIKKADGVNISTAEIKAFADLAAQVPESVIIRRINTRRKQANAAPKTNHSGIRSFATIHLRGAV